MKLKCLSTFTMSMRGKVYNKVVGDIFEADDASAKTLVQLKLAEEFVEPKPSRKAKVIEEVIEVVEGVVEDAISKE